MPLTDVSSYPWNSDAVFVAALDADGHIVQANPALRSAWDGPLEGVPFSDLLPAEQIGAFQRRLAELGEDWQRATYAFFVDGAGTEDRCIWLRRLPEGRVDLVAEPAWQERDRLIEQVLQLNDDLIASQRSVTRRQRDLEHAQDHATRSALRIGQLEAILLAGLTPQDFDGALHSLLRIAQDLLPGDRIDILLVDEDSDRLVLRASAGAGVQDEGRQRVALGEGVLGRIAGSETSILIEDLGAVRRTGIPEREGSLIGAPLRVEGEVIGVLVVTAAHIGCFSAADRRLLELVGERVALAVGQAQIRDREHRMAETLQRTLLPQALPKLPGIQLAAAYLPHTASVGGDFYDAIALPDGRLGVAIGDVTGKGLRAAAAMSRLRSALHAYALDRPAPADVLSRLGRMAQADDAIATALYLVLDASTGRIELGSAGHLPPLLIDRDGEARYVDVRRALSPPLGLEVEHRQQLAADLAVGEMLVLYTDGLVELTRNIDDGMRVLAETAVGEPGEPPRVLCDRLLAQIAPEGRYRDDVAVLAVRRGGVQG